MKNHITAVIMNNDALESHNIVKMTMIKHNNDFFGFKIVIFYFYETSLSV